jgi:hypothetical protein
MTLTNWIKEPNRPGWYWFKSNTQGLSNPIQVEFFNGEIYILAGKYRPIEVLGPGLWVRIEEPK